MQIGPSISIQIRDSPPNPSLNSASLCDLSLESPTPGKRLLKLQEWENKRQSLYKSDNV